MTRLPRLLEALARMLTYLLCHRPDEFGLILSAEGFISIKKLLQALAAEPGWGFVRRHHVLEVAALSQPPRFEVKDEQIRGLIPGPARLRRPPGEPPPASLFLTIPPRSHERVWQEGLKAAPGKELLLATTPEFAQKLGRRRSPETILVTVQAQAAARSGITFTPYGDELFLAPALSRKFLQLPPPREGREKAKTERPPRPQPTPGAVLLDIPGILQETPKLRGKKGDPAWKAGARALRKKRRGER
jgi:putative RNA 2'-phosphotransferase